jgi:stage V sporulation protein B
VSVTLATTLASIAGRASSPMNMDDSERRGRAFARSIGLNFFGQVAVLVLGIVPSLLVARWLGPSDRGLLGLMLTASGIVLVVVNVGLTTAVAYFSSRRDAPHGALFGNSLLYGVLLLVVLTPPAWFYSDQIADLIARGRGGHLWALAAALVSLTFLDWTTHNQLLGRFRFGLYNVLITLSKVVSLIGVVVLIGVAGKGIGGYLVATGAGNLLVIVGSATVILRWAKPRIDRALFRTMLAYGSKVQLGGLFQLFNSRFDVFILQFYRPLSAVGYYVVAQTLAELVMVLARAFQSSILPLVSYDSDDPDRQADSTVMSMRHHAILAGGATVVNAVFSPLLILFGYGDAFRPALLPFFIILPGVWFFGTGLVAANDLNGRGRPGLSSALSAVAVSITLGLDFLLIPPYGVTGAAIASLVAYTVLGVTSLIALGRVSGVRTRDLMPTRAELALYPAASRVVFSRVQSFVAGLSPLGR